MARTSSLRRWLLLIVGYVAIVGAVLLGSLLINDHIDRAILLALNPDRYVPVVDEAMIFITDFSKFCFASVCIVWQIGYYVCRNRPRAKRWVEWAFRLLAVVFGGYGFSGYFWQDYQCKVVFIPLGLALLCAFWLAGMSFTRGDDRTLRKYGAVFWLVALSVFLTNALSEGFIKQTVHRPRPLADVNNSWNAAIRVLPDEVVRGSYSYASGHASSLFALITPIVWAVRRRDVKAALLLWAGLHAYSRIYTAAHFPYCAFMGSVLGFAIGSWVYYVFRDTLTEDAPAESPIAGSGT